MAVNSSLPSVATLLSRLRPDLPYVQLPLDLAAAGEVRPLLSLLSADAETLVAQMGLVPVIDSSYCHLFRVRSHPDSWVQVHHPDQGFLPRGLADTLLAQRVPEAMPGVPHTWRLLPAHASLASTYSRWLHRPAQLPLWAPGTDPDPVALQSLARALARLNARPCKPQNETIPFHTGAARCLAALGSGSMADPGPGFDGAITHSTSLEADRRALSVHWLHPFLSHLVGRVLLLGPEGLSRDVAAQFLLDAGCDLHLQRTEPDIQGGPDDPRLAGCKWIDDPVWANKEPQGFDAVVVQDLGGWCLQNLPGPTVANWLVSLGPRGDATQAPRSALLAEGLHALAPLAKPGATFIVQQPALQRQGPHHLGSFEPEQAIAHGPWQVLAQFAAMGDCHAPRVWASMPLLASPTPALMNLLVASTGPHSHQVTEWAHALQQGQGPQLASAWAWILSRRDPEASAAPVAAPAQALAYVLGPLGSEALTTPSGLLAPGASTALQAFFKVGTSDGWTFAQWAAILRRYLAAVQTLFPDPPRVGNVTLQASDTVPVSWCSALPDAIAFGPGGVPVALAVGKASTPSPYLALDKPPSAAGFVLAALLRVLDSLPQMGPHESARRFTRLQWLENLLAEAGLPWLAQDFAAAGLPASAWLGDALLPTPVLAPELQARDQTIAGLEARVHSVETERNIAQFQLDQARDLARTLTADVRRTVAEEVTQEVSAAITVRVSEAVAQGYETTLSWRVTRPLRQARALLQKWRGHTVGGVEEPRVATGQADEVPPSAAQAPPAYESTGSTRALDFFADPVPAAPSQGEGRWNYGAWVTQFDTIDRFARHRMADKLAQLPDLPAIALLCAPLPSQWQGLADLLADLKGQAFMRWTLSLALPDGVVVEERLLAQLRAEPRVTLVDVPAHATFEEVLAQLQNATPPSTQWLGWLPANARLSLKALAAYATALQAPCAWQVVYADVDTIDAAGCRTAPNFKPDWNPSLFFSSALAPNPSHSLVSGLVLARRALWTPALASQYALHLANIPEANGSPGVVSALARAGNSGGSALFNLCLVLRALAEGFVDNKGLPLPPVQAIAHIACVTEHLRPYTLTPPERTAGLALLKSFFEQTGQAAEVSLTDWGARVQTPVYPPGSPVPFVSLVIPTRNNPRLLAQCVRSLLEKTDYPAYEILVVDNGSDTPEALTQLAELAQNPKVRVIRDSSPFNYSDLNNAAVAKARGRYIALVNDDIEVIDGHWLSEMVSHASQPEVGVVGAKLLYPNGTVQHAGVFLVGSLSWHAHRHLGQGEAGYCGRAQLVQNYSCVTAACLVVRKSLYEQLGGLDAQHFTVGWNDTDFCLKVLRAGYRNVWTPHAVLLHHESATRGQDHTPEKSARAEVEYRAMQKRWGDAMNHDPAYSDNLSCGYEDFSLAWPPRGTLFKDLG